MRAALLLLLLSLGESPTDSPGIHHVRGGDSAAASPRLTEARALAGAWVGHWTRASGGQSQPVEISITPSTDPARIVGQFTFLTGAQSWTARREGVVVDDAVRFELAGGGSIALRSEPHGQLSGSFEAPSGRLPAERGLLLTYSARLISWCRERPGD